MINKMKARSQRGGNSTFLQRDKQHRYDASVPRHSAKRQRWRGKYPMSWRRFFAEIPPTATPKFQVFDAGETNVTAQVIGLD
jgi:hypothetical protein